MIIYIHGFGSSGQGGKAKVFREYFKSINEPFIAPSLSYVPTLAIKTLEELIESYEDVQLIGSSLGGFYSIHLAQKYDLKAVVINPSIYPYHTLENYLGYAQNFYDESSFEWNALHVEMLKEYESQVTKQENFMLLVQKGDELLDYQEALDKLPKAKVCLEDGGSHNFDHIEQHFERILKYIKEGRK
jgi:predicted esterase YcpF (UPF0227 family)